MQRIPELDAIRGLAAIGVVLFHAYPNTFYFGWSCVDLFFVLSGYLITSIILTDQKDPNFLSTFYLRRIRRIWPVYYLTLIVVLILNRFSVSGYPTDGLWLHWIFLQNTTNYIGLLPLPFIYSFSPSWSVAIEEQFYVVWPLVVRTIGKSAVPIFSGLLFLSCFLGRCWLTESTELLLTRGDGLSLGCMLAWLMQFNSDARLSKIILASLICAATLGCGYVLLYWIAFNGDPTPRWTQSCFTGFSLLFFSLIGFSVRHSGAWILMPLRNSVLKWFGTISYALYLFHMPLFSYCPPIFDRIGMSSEILRATITWVLVVGLPALSWYAIERPILSRHTALHKAVGRNKRTTA